MTYTPDTPLEALAGIGPKKAQAFQKLGVATLRDLAGLYPRRYEDRTQFRTIADAQPGEAVCIRAAVAAEPRAQYVRSGLTLVKVRIADDTGALDVTYFNQPYRKNNLHAGETYIFYGKVEANGFRKTMTNCRREKATQEDILIAHTMDRSSKNRSNICSHSTGYTLLVRKTFYRAK